MEESKEYSIRVTDILWFNRIVNDDFGVRRTDRKMHTWYCPVCKSKYYFRTPLTRSELPDVCPSCGKRMKIYSVVKKTSA